MTSGLKQQAAMRNIPDEEILLFLRYFQIIS